jgi:hypothetical protein
LAKPNYSFEKRQRELAKKQKKEEKRNRKPESDEPVEEPVTPQPPEAGQTPA